MWRIQISNAAIFLLMAFTPSQTLYGQNMSPTFALGRYTFPNQPELLGGSFMPNGQSVEAGLADWDLLNFQKRQFLITEVRLYGFGRYFEKRCLDWKTTSETTIKAIRFGLHGANIRRRCLSDFSVGRSQFGRGAHIGVLQIFSERQPLIIGVSERGFYLNICHGTEHQAFESWVLARQLDQLIFELSGQHIEEQTFARLSGEQLLENGKAYWKSRERGMITEEEAREIGRKHFDRPKDSGLYLDDRGEYFFVAPPIKTAKDIEKAGVFINKRTGEITKNSPRDS